MEGPQGWSRGPRFLPRLPQFCSVGVRIRRRGMVVLQRRQQRDTSDHLEPWIPDQRLEDFDPAAVLQSGDFVYLDSNYVSLTVEGASRMVHADHELTGYMPPSTKT